jgi:hypothetical protein
MEFEMSKNKEFIVEKKQELDKEQEMLNSVEEKWIRGEIAKDTLSGGIPLTAGI